MYVCNCHLAVLSDGIQYCWKVYVSLVHCQVTHKFLAAGSIVISAGTLVLMIGGVLLTDELLSQISFYMSNSQFFSYKKKIPRNHYTIYLCSYGYSEGQCSGNHGLCTSSSNFC